MYVTSDAITSRVYANTAVNGLAIRVVAEWHDILPIAQLPRYATLGAMGKTRIKIDVAKSGCTTSKHKGWC
eukprot:4199176-Amphidinium_carterae.3